MSLFAVCLLICVVCCVIVGFLGQDRRPRLDLVPCPTCASFDYDPGCPECLGHGCIPIDRDLETPPTEPLGVPANFEVYGPIACGICGDPVRQLDGRRHCDACYANGQVDRLVEENLLDWLENNPRPEASDPRDYWDAEAAVK